MISAHRQSGRPQPTLLSVLRRAHLNIALVAVTIVGLSLTLTGAVALLAYANDSLNLVARAISYNVEAAVVFGDRGATHDAMASIAATEDVAKATVTDARGQIIAHWEKPSRSLFATLGRTGMTLLRDHPVVMPITHDGVLVGNVALSGSGQNLLRFVLSGLLGVVICQVLIVASAMYLSRRMMASIVKPLQTLATVAHAVRRQRDFEQRVPATQIIELNDLGENFNALLDELDRWQSHLKSENASLVHKASHDSLTRLPNRAFFENQLTLAIADAARRGMRAAVLFLDCDRFKAINDNYGHAAGDAVLISIAARIRAQVRETDTAVRLGGDEFALLIAPIHDTAVAVSIADDLLAGMQAPMTLPTGENIVTSLSIGIAIYPDHALDADALLHKADQAMYRAKSTQRGSRGLAVRITDS
jgi:diguanylate cyclase (GGDEF)-like protein